MKSCAAEYIQTKDLLDDRCNDLLNHNEVKTKRRLDSQSERKELNEKLEKLRFEYSDLFKKYIKHKRNFQYIEKKLAQHLNLLPNHCC